MWSVWRGSRVNCETCLSGCNFLKIIRRRHFDVTDLNQLFKTGASHNACLHIDSLSFDVRLYFKLCLKCYYVQCFRCVARLYFYSAFLLYNLDFILLWTIFNAICFMCFIFVNSVIVFSIISCNDLYQDFIVMYVWYFVSRNSTSV